jgi:archaellum component FlaC
VSTKGRKLADLDSGFDKDLKKQTRSPVIEAVTPSTEEQVKKLEGRYAELVKEKQKMLDEFNGFTEALQKKWNEENASVQKQVQEFDRQAAEVTGALKFLKGEL